MLGSLSNIFKSDNDSVNSSCYKWDGMGAWIYTIGKYKFRRIIVAVVQASCLLTIKEFPHKMAFPKRIFTLRNRWIPNISKLAIFLKFRKHIKFCLLQCLKFGRALVSLMLACTRAKISLSCSRAKICLSNYRAIVWKVLSCRST